MASLDAEIGRATDQINVINKSEPNEEPDKKDESVKNEPVKYKQPEVQREEEHELVTKGSHKAKTNVADVHPAVNENADEQIAGKHGAQASAVHGDGAAPAVATPTAPLSLSEIEAIDMALANIAELSASLRDTVASEVDTAAASSSSAINRHKMTDIANRSEARALTQLALQREALQELRRCYELRVVPEGLVFMDLLKGAMDGHMPPCEAPAKAKVCKVKPILHTEGSAKRHRKKR